MKSFNALEKQYDEGKLKLEPSNRELCDRLDKYSKMVNELVIEEDETKEMIESYKANKITQKELLDGIVKKMVNMVEVYTIKEYQYMCAKQGYEFKNIKEFIDFQKEYTSAIEKLTDEEILETNIELLEDVGKDNFIFIMRQSMIYYKEMINNLEKLLQWSRV